MKSFFENIRSFFQKFKRKPIPQADVPAINEPPTSPRASGALRAKPKVDRFSIISWAVTIFIVAALLGSTLYYKSTLPAAVDIPAAQPTSESNTGSVGQPQAGEPIVGGEGSGVPSILRKLQLITNIPERPRYESVIYRVSRGDAMLAIADEFKLKSESILYVNTQLEDNPHNLKPGMELTIPPVDGLYYEWKDGDTFEMVAEKFDADAEEIINFPGNNIDLTNPNVEPGTLVMIPGGARDLRAWEQDLQTAGRGANTGTGGSNATNSCGGGPVASGFGWPASSHAISGSGYGPGHLGLDIQASEGEPVYAAGNGIVTMAQGGWNYGYGNVVQIDHGNGYVTVYAHLSTINVSQCTPVGQGSVIGAAGNTGNSFGAHLHFEVRIGGSNINPYDIVQ
ncbi:MAG: peptidoglycan DD-metalloendopeptidase family protein [Chloroflexi bacterium]|nr:peptidoglycan DD-metalloendopeptidase family protein [Chloroflexota bacterium]